LDAKNLINIF